jgi:hypothetical protein
VAAQTNVSLFIFILEDFQNEGLSESSVSAPGVATVSRQRLPDLLDVRSNQAETGRKIRRRA